MTNVPNEKWIGSQEQVEDFACLAHDVKVAVERLERAFAALEGWPEPVGDNVPVLVETAKSIADWAVDWARVSNCDFSPTY